MNQKGTSDMFVQTKFSDRTKEEGYTSVHTVAREVNSEIRNKEISKIKFYREDSKDIYTTTDVKVFYKDESDKNTSTITLNRNNPKYENQVDKLYTSYTKLKVQKTVNAVKMTLLTAAAVTAIATGFTMLTGGFSSNQERETPDTSYSAPGQISIDTYNQLIADGVDPVEYRNNMEQAQKEAEASEAAKEQALLDEIRSSGEAANSYTQPTTEQFLDNSQYGNNNNIEQSTGKGK